MSLAECRSVDCLNCEGTDTGTQQELNARGWQSHTIPGGRVYLCEDCTREFSERRRAKTSSAA